MAYRLRRNWDFLKLLSNGKRNVRRKILSTGHNDLIKCISECCLNVIKGNVNLNPEQKTKLIKHKKVIRKLARKRLALKKKRTILLQKGGALPALLIPILSLVGSLIIDAVRK